jgi:hypothetical protein
VASTPYSIKSRGGRLDVLPRGGNELTCGWRHQNEVIGNGRWCFGRGDGDVPSLLLSAGGPANTAGPPAERRRMGIFGTKKKLRTIVQVGILREILLVRAYSMRAELSIVSNGPLEPTSRPSKPMKRITNNAHADFNVKSLLFEISRENFKKRLALTKSAFSREFSPVKLITLTTKHN